jgi:peptidoglycan/LPS O-acetylase OafA/YrhL
VGHGGNLPGFEAFRFMGFNLNNAVSFFFVLSGFIMSLSYYGMDIKRDFRFFITARFSRIYPAHFFMFIVYFCVFGPNIFHEGPGRTHLLR